MGPPISQIEKGRVSGKDIYDILDIVPKINQKDDSKNAELTNGEIIFENVHFSYPSRSNIKILSDLS